MAKGDDETTELTDWADWFHMCADAVEPARVYERLIWLYHKLMEGRRGAGLVGSDFASRHRMAFWRHDRPIAGFAVAHAVVAAAVTFAVTLAVAMAASGMGTLAETIGFEPTAEAPLQTLVDTLPASLALAAAVFVCWCAVFVVRRLSLVVRMRGCERKLARPLSLVPPNYRNSFCLDAFDQMFTSYGVGTMATALDACDRYIEANGDSYRAIYLMYDLSYDGEGRRDVRLAGEEGAEAEPDDSDPNLPADIKDKVRRGPADPERELRSLIGMDDVKRQVRQMRNRLEFSQGKASLGNNNAALLGDAGVGKTVVARIMCGLLYEMGYIRQNRIVEVDGDYLKSPYQGQTGARTQAVINYAVGGVLFIDEAYLLVSDKGGAGAEAVGVLLKAMEDMRDQVVVILAGYEDPMTRLIMSNEGFKSRIRYTIHFKPYTPEELMLIFEKFMRDSEAMRDMLLDPKARAIIRDELRRESTHPGFGNARAARNALDAVYDIHADRVVRGIEHDRMTLTEADAREWVSRQADASAVDARQMMAASGIDTSIISVDELRGRTHPGAKDPDAALSEMIGLDSVKEQIADLKAQMEFYRGDPDHSARGINGFSLEGNPGSGKTSVVSIITGLLFEMGYIQRDEYVDVSGDFLRAPYLGQTGKRTEATVAYATGGVLFVDEAYLLASGEDGKADQFGAEAVGVLVNAMEKHQDDLVVMLAGYPEEMAHLYDVNPGLRSRVGVTLTFPDYSPKDICKIFQLMCAKRGFSVDRAVWRPLAAAAEAERDPKFGNGRWARQLADASVRVHARRFTDGDVAPERRMVLDATDVARALERQREEG